ncbi:MAG: hypothetical protein ACLP4R_22675 [Solirubrobacteraceae bacterium]
MAGSSGPGTVAGSSGAAGEPGSGTAGVTGALGTAGVGGTVGCGTSEMMGSAAWCAIPMHYPVIGMVTP